MKKMNWLGLILALVMCLALVPAQAETMEVAEICTYSVESPYTNDELFAAYVQSEMDKSVYGDAAVFGTLGRSKLTTEASRKLYDAVKAMIIEVAAGNRASTTYAINLGEMGFKYEYTNADLGEPIYEVVGDYAVMLPSAKAKLDAIVAQMLEDLGLSNRKLINALMQDCPYELYWFKKDSGYGLSYGGGSGMMAGNVHTYTFQDFSISFAVASEYGSDYTADTSKTGAVAAAINKAQAIVDKYEHLSDEEKLLAYKNEICELTSYNFDAADDSNNTPYGNPWQLIWVFDGNPSTTVVCEGYSKAFAYLCDLSDFDSAIYCYTVSGKMNGGAHMWNIVQTPNGNYLVDVTNCDSGMIGNPDNLYMVSKADGSWDKTYQVAIKGQGTVSYTYNSDEISMWGEEVLKLGENHTHSWKPVSYTWSSTYGACSATRQCDCGESETVFAVVQQTVKQEGSCKDVGINTYTATFSADWASTQTKDVETGIAITNHVGGSEQRDQKPATCSENGYTGDVYCLGCGGLIGKGLITSPTGEHSFTMEVETIASTCKTPGSVTKKCANCAATDTQALPLDAANHAGETELRNVVAAGCGAEGYTGDTWCLDCETKIKAGETVPATGEHSYTASAYTWNADQTECVATGVCGVCEDETSANAEITEEQILAPTCSLPGKVRVIASFEAEWAADQYKEKSVPSTEDHTFQPEEYLWNDDHTKCSAVGICECGVQLEREAAEITESVITAPTCGKDGEKKITARFDESWAEEQSVTVAIPATGEHSFTVDVETIASTCKTPGSVTKKCANCAATDTQTLPLDAANHAGETELRDVVAATCGAEGYTGDTWCLDCETKIKAGETVPATGEHNYAIEVEGTRVSSTCNQQGRVLMQCTGCTASQSQLLPFDYDEHEGEIVLSGAKEATCTEDGYTGDTGCLACGKIITKGDVIPATGEHAYGEPSYNWADDFIACTATRACTCGRTESVKANVSFETTKAATCSAEGEKTYTATFEKEWAQTQTQTKTIAKNPENHVGETEVRDAVNATCAVDGYTGDTYCLGCETKIADGETVPATGEHVYGEVSYDWGDDLSACTASHACGCEHTETAEAKVTSEITTAPTCADEGEETFTATFEKDWAAPQTEKAAVAKDPENHVGETEVRDAVNATCAVDGYTGDTYCLGCETKIADGETVPATGEHVYGEVSYDWADDLSACEASRACGCEYTETAKAKVTSEITTVPTCAAEGEETFTATFEKDWAATQTEKAAVAKDPENHVGETEVRDAVKPSCAVDGYSGDTYCLGCETKIADGETVPATGEHVYGEVSYDWADDLSACEASRACGCEYTETAEAKVTSEITTVPTCAAEGEKTFTATFEKDWAAPQTKKAAVAKDPENHTGETEVRDAVKPSCAVDGYSGDTYCLGCETKIADGETVPATGEHVYGEVSYDWADDLSACTASHACGCEYTETAEAKVTSEITTAPTCAAAGEKTFTATFEKDWAAPQTEKAAVAKDPENHTGETEVRDAVKPSCAVDGYTGDTYCLGCETKIADGETVPATGEHVYGEVSYDWADDLSACEASRACGCEYTETAEAKVTSEITTVPTCAADGEKTFTATFEQEWAATQTEKAAVAKNPENHTGETYKKDEKTADCANDGYTGDTYCKGCDVLLEKGEAIPATGEHNHAVEVEGTKVPSTCKTPGKVTMKCTGCEDTEEQPLPLDPEKHEGETEVRGAVKATCTTDGYTGDTYCLGCETKIEEGEVIPAGHVDEDGDDQCDNCPVVLAYRIHIAPAEGGSAAASSEKAAAGDEVFITLTPDEGMEMEALMVTLESGETITPRLTGENRYVYTQPAGDVTVRAFFKAVPVAEKHTVTFHANGGLGVMMPVQVDAGQPYTLPECAFIPAEGYAFKGWALTADGPLLPATVTVGGNIDLYAIWSAAGGGVPDAPVPPATGDSANLILWTVLMVLSGACIVYLLTGRKRKA